MKQTGDEKKNIKILFVDPIPNSPNAYHKNCMADSKENYQQDLGSENIRALKKIEE